MKKVKMNKTLIGLVIACICLSGCSAAGVPYTNDPYKLIEYSLYLSSVDRPISARKLLLKAMGKVDSNNINLQAHAYRAQGYLILSDEYQKYKKSHDWNEEIDGEVSDAERRYLFAIEKFVYAKSYYEASNTAWLLSYYYKGMGLKQQQCQALIDSKQYHIAGAINDPEKGKDVYVDKVGTSYVDYIDKLENDEGCHIN